MADVTKTVAIIFQGQDNLTPKVKDVEDAMRGVSQSATAAAPKIDEAADASKRLGGTSNSINELRNAFQLLAGSIVVKEFIAANVAIENFGRAMTVVTGSTAAAGESLDYVRKTSDTLGLEITSTAQNFLSLSAAAKGTTLEGQQTRDIFEAVSKAMALLGKSSADTSGALTAIQQIISKGTVSSEELRGQLGERLPGAFQIAARAVGVTTQELGKMLEQGQVVAADFLPKFAEELNKTFGDTDYVTTFNAELNRLINSIKGLAVAGGDAGIFGALTDAVRDVTGVFKATTLEIDFLGKAFAATRNFLASGGEDWDGYKAAMQRARIETSIASDEFFNTNESLAETARLARAGKAELIDWAQQVNESSAESKRLGLEGADATANLAAAYKTLGISVKSAGADVIGALSEIVKASGSTGDDISKALKIVIPKIDNAGELEEVVKSLQIAANDGKITWQRYAVEVDKASDAFLKNTGYAGDNAKEIAKQAKEAKDAEKATRDYGLEMEKIASNERIKGLEFRINFDIEKVKANAEIVIAAFDSINKSIESTGDVLGSVFDAFDGLGNLDAAARNALFAQIDKENALREKAFELQKALTEAQIENLRAQTANIERGDALIKVDGAGLQPHLEAFMWEILKAIQVRVNQQGLAQLLGVP